MRTGRASTGTREVAEARRVGRGAGGGDSIARRLAIVVAVGVAVGGCTVLRSLMHVQPVSSWTELEKECRSINKEHLSRKTPSERVSYAESLDDLEQEYLVYLCGRHCCHHGKYLVEPIVGRGPEAIPFLADRVERTEEDMEVRDILVLLSFIDGRSYDVAGDEELMVLLQARVDSIPDAWDRCWAQSKLDDMGPEPETHRTRYISSCVDEELHIVLTVKVSENESSALEKAVLAHAHTWAESENLSMEGECRRREGFLQCVMGVSADPLRSLLVREQVDALLVHVEDLGYDARGYFQNFSWGGSPKWVTWDESPSGGEK